MAAAAQAEMRAKGRRICRGLLQDLHDPGFGELGFFPGNPHPHLLAGNGMVHEHDEAVHPAQGFAAKGQLVDDQINFRAFG